jgi:hypothetical protein
MSRCWVPLLMLLLSAAVARGNLEIRQFPYQKSLTVPDNKDCPVYAFFLDSDLYAVTDESYANLRIVDEQGAEVPFYLHRKTHSTTQVVETAVSSKILGLETKDEHRIGIQVEVDVNSGIPDVLVVKTGDHNFEKFVTVYGSDTLSQWNVLVEEARIFDYARFIDIRNTRIELPRRGYKYLRIDISNLTEHKAPSEIEVTLEKRGDVKFSETERRIMRDETIHIDGVELYARRSEVRADDPFRAAYPVDDLKVTPDEKRRASIWTFESARQPIVSLSFEVANKNFSRSFIVEGQRSESTWDWVGEATLYHLDIGSLKDSKLTLPLRGECRYPRYRVTIYNQDNPALDIRHVVATGSVYEVLFLPPSASPRTILYGGENVPAPRYDVSALLRTVPNIAPCQCALGGQTPNPQFEPGLKVGGTKVKVFFGVAMAAVVLLLGWLIAKGAKKIEKQ